MNNEGDSNLWLSSDPRRMKFLTFIGKFLFFDFLSQLDEFSSVSISIFPLNKIY